MRWRRKLMPEFQILTIAAVIEVALVVVPETKTFEPTLRAFDVVAWPFSK